MSNLQTKMVIPDVVLQNFPTTKAIFNDDVSLIPSNLNLFCFLEELADLLEIEDKIKEGKYAFDANQLGQSPYELVESLIGATCAILADLEKLDWEKFDFSCRIDEICGEIMYLAERDPDHERLVPLVQKLEHTLAFKSNTLGGYSQSLH